METTSRRRLYGYRGDAALESRPAYSIPLLLRQAIPGFLVAALAVRLLAPVGDPDTFWHLRAGAELLRNWTFVGPDPWSPLTTEPWVRHEWLGEAILAAADRLGGLAGVAYLRPLAATVLGMVLMWSTRSRTSLIPSILITVVAMFTTLPSFSLRPQVLSFIFAAAFAGAWVSSTIDLRPRWWLIPLTWVWACAHGFWFIGPVIGLIVTMGLALDRMPRRGVLTMASIPLAGLVAAGLTPVGWHVYTAPFTIGASTSGIQEWMPSSITSPQVAAALILIAACVVIGMRSPAPSSWCAILLVALATVLALKYARTTALAGPIIAPVTAQYAERVIPLAREDVVRREKILAGSFAGVGLVVAASLSPAAGHTVGYPESLAAALGRFAPGTVVCNQYSLGGWLWWKQTSVIPAIDGRTELYPAGYVGQYRHWLGGASDWRTFLDRTKCRAAIVPGDSAIAGILQHQLSWREVASEDGKVLLQPGHSSVG